MLHIIDLHHQLLIHPQAFLVPPIQPVTPGNFGLLTMAPAGNEFLALEPHSKHAWVL
jgi:hypothetical protein